MNPPPLLKPAHRKLAPGARRRGLTLLELLFALAGTALVGVAIASMLTAVSYGTTSRTGMRALVVRQKVFASRFTAAVRGAREVMSVSNTESSTALVLWEQDDNDNGRPDMAEIRRIAWDPDNQKLWSYTSDDTNSDQDLTDRTTIDTLTQTLADDDTLTGKLWAKRVVACAFHQNSEIKSLVTCELTLREDDGPASAHVDEPSIITAAMRYANPN